MNEMFRKRKKLRSNTNRFCMARSLRFLRQVTTLKQVHAARRLASLLQLGH